MPIMHLKRNGRTAVSDGRKSLLVGTVVDGTAKVVESGTGVVKTRLAWGGVRRMAFNRDGTKLAWATGREAGVTEVMTGKDLFRSLGDRFAATDGRSIMAWDAASQDR